MNGITYYRLKSDYIGDITKDTSLRGEEVDNNFHVLEGRDVKSLDVVGSDIVLTLLNGDKVISRDALDLSKLESIKNSISGVEFDRNRGILTLIKFNGSREEINGFSTTTNVGNSVYRDNTLDGDGTKNSPLTISRLYNTGQYKPVKSLIDLTNGGKLLEKNNKVGDRYITSETISDYGYLYDYKDVTKIACLLKGSGWRIPTKEDWDDLLNGVEPREMDRDHNSMDKNHTLGRWAGRLLKSKDGWLPQDTVSDCETCSSEINQTCASHYSEDYFTCNKSENSCVATKEAEVSCSCSCDKKKPNTFDFDAYGFNVKAAGYADDGCNFGYFKERAAFWTATTSNDSAKAFMKRFHYNKDGVYQDFLASNYHLSLRLVKDYNGQNFSDIEHIVDMDYPTAIFPSASKGSAIWTTVNFSSKDSSLTPKTPNNGNELTSTKKFFINEWDGFKWVRTEFKEGYSVVLEEDSHYNRFYEYRLIDGEFVSVNTLVSKAVLTEVNNRIDGLELRITTEGETRESEVRTINDELTSIKGKQTETDTKLTELSEKIKSTESQSGTDLTEKFNALNEEIKKVKDNSITKNGSLYNPNTGMLTLKSVSGENDINIQLSFNFGEF